jgi:hypothetical protein
MDKSDPTLEAARAAAGLSDSDLKDKDGSEQRLARLGFGSSQILHNGRHVVLCFDTAAFSSPTFDAHEFVSSYLTSQQQPATDDSSASTEEKNSGGDSSALLNGGAIIPANATSLETLMRDLQLYGDELKTALVDLLNREYTVRLHE